MKNLHRIATSLRRFTRDEQGSALPFLGLGILMLVAATGSAVDMGRVQLVQSRMQSALDATGLAVGSSISTANIATETTKYFYANFPTGYNGSTITSLTATPNGLNSIINLSVTGTVSTTFMRVMGINSVAVSATSQVLRQSKGLELVLIIDNTGSMTSSAGGSATKIQAAKTASTTLLDVLYGSTNNTVPNLWVGLVPFSQTVNVGTSRTTWVNAGSHAWGTGTYGTWFGCVEARGATNRDVTDDPPSVEPFNKYYYPCNTSSNAWYGNDSDYSYDNCSTGSSRFGYKTPLNTSSRGPNLYCPQPLTALVAEKSTVNTAIKAMQAVGGTELTTGIAWGWRMLSPRWRTLWGGQMNTNNLPLDYNTALMYKVAIIMTDGDNDISSNVYSAYGYPNTGGQLGTTPCSSSSNCTTGEGRLNTRTTQLCTAMKNNGIIIYTIALGTAVSTTGQNLLRDCATSPDYYFLSPTTNELQTIFRQIGDSLANLRISQ